MGRTRVLRIATQNIQAMPRMLSSKVKDDISDIAERTDLIGWQEIKHANYREILGKLEDSGKWETYWGRGRAQPELDEHYDRHFLLNFATPISWRHEVFSFMTGGSWKLHSQTSGICGERWVTWVLLEEKNSGAKLLVYNFHMVAGAWNPRVKSRKDQRQAMWVGAWMDIQRDIRAKKAKFPGAAVVGMADFNAKFSRDKRQLRKRLKGMPRIRFSHPKGVDHVFMMNGAKFKWGPHLNRIEQQHSDHEGKYVKVRLYWR